MSDIYINVETMQQVLLTWIIRIRRYVGTEPQLRKNSTFIRKKLARC